ncbi:4'-phosphopantetheinyl transferase family protein [Haoranjiania flava]|uniref:4'-phosphopantetheinyl transferase superfamily protein n=1 Tax=Haoranjiania flava TaxID=1856322 RepID=A0AAE3IKY5_9BACT|nr:4'-phosphopantetheinyl transferase superfamily protein [Haoranjiania flava]MCU7694045.1 4'-phosphopantetheinyl transferase superfamily protein [Haoranjiania flava]
MPLFFQKNISTDTKLAIWHIQEEECFFTGKVLLQNRVYHPHKRLQHLAGRYLLSFLFPEFPHDEILIADTRKPYLKSDAFHFSISHCGDYAAAIVSQTNRVGIDIEMFRDKVLKLKHKFLNEAEVSFVEYSEDEKKMLTTLWSAKESVFKWWSYGGVDFSEHILIQSFFLQPEGRFDAAFSKDGKYFPMQINYKLFEELSLTYVITNGKHH